MTNFKEGLRSIKAFVFDVDGVLSSPQVLLHPSGDLMRTMNTKDGFAMYQAIQENFPIAIISGAKSKSIIERFAGLGIKDVYIDSKDKTKDLQKFLSDYDLDPQSVLYMGDDIPDYPVMKLAGLPCCPQDAVPEIKEISKYISHKKGGKGAVRDVIEQVLKVQDKWNGNFNAKYD